MEEKTLIKIVSNNLKLIRELRRYKQEFMAAELHVSQATYSKYETGQIEIPLSKLEIAAFVFEIPLPELLKADGRKISDAEVIADFQALYEGQSSTEIAALHEKQVTTLLAEIEFLRRLIEDMRKQA